MFYFVSSFSSHCWKYRQIFLSKYTIQLWFPGLQLLQALSCVYYSCNNSVPQKSIKIKSGTFFPSTLALLQVDCNAFSILLMSCCAWLIVHSGLVIKKSEKSVNFRVSVFPFVPLFTQMKCFYRIKNSQSSFFVIKNELFWYKSHWLIDEDFLGWVEMPVEALPWFLTGYPHGVDFSQVILPSQGLRFVSPVSGRDWGVHIESWKGIFAHLPTKDQGIPHSQQEVKWKLYKWPGGIYMD